MKTVKRKAEVGEKILSSQDNMVHEVVSRDWFGVGTAENLTVPHAKYEVIIEDEPKVHPGTVKNPEGLKKALSEVIELGDNIPPHSSHYHQNGLDPLEVMRRTFPPEQYEGFLRGNVLKYAMRYDQKGQQKADLEKLNFYSQELAVFKRQQND